MTIPDKCHLFGMTSTDLQVEMERAGFGAFRARQVMNWVYGNNVRDFDSMTNLPASLRRHLEKHCYPVISTIEETSPDPAGNTRILLRLSDNSLTECVLMTSSGRNVVCLSTQVGCAVGCAFCASGAGGFTRNLAPGEIVEQFLHATDLLQNGSSLQGAMFMGMGEPFLNLENTLKALEILTSPDCAGLGARHITVSTVGVINGMRELTHTYPQVRLAISLHAPDEETRRKIVPRPPSTVEEIISALRELQKGPGRRVTIEYVLAAGLNDSEPHARELAGLLRGLKVYVNLIPFNPVANCPFERPAGKSLDAFRKVLERAGVETHVRRSLGVGVSGGCGQLAARKRK